MVNTHHVKNGREGSAQRLSDGSSRGLLVAAVLIASAAAPACATIAGIDAPRDRQTEGGDFAHGSGADGGPEQDHGSGQEDAAESSFSHPDGTDPDVGVADAVTETALGDVSIDMGITDGSHDADARQCRPPGGGCTSGAQCCSGSCDQYSMACN